MTRRNPVGSRGQHQAIFIVAAIVLFAILRLIGEKGPIQAYDINRLAIALTKSGLHSESPKALENWRESNSKDGAESILCRLPLAVQVLSDTESSATFDALQTCLHQKSVRPKLVLMAMVMISEENSDVQKLQELMQPHDELALYILQLSQSSIENSEFQRSFHLLSILDDREEYVSTVAHLRARAFLGLTMTAEARREYQYALKHNSYYPDFVQVTLHSTYYELGRLAYTEGDWPLALTCFKSAVESNPSNAYIWMRMGLTYLIGFDDYQQAESAFLRSLELGSLESSHWGLSKVYQAQERHYAALHEMLEAYKVSKNRRYLTEIIEMLPLLPRDVLAAEAFSSMASLKVDDSEFFLALSRIYHENGLHKQAEQFTLLAHQ